MRQTSINMGAALAALLVGTAVSAMAKDPGQLGSLHGSEIGARSETMAQAEIINNTSWNGPYKESEIADRVCGQNEVMVGRSHKDDEHGDTEYLCGKVKQLGEFAPVTGLDWSGWVEENDHRYTCPDNSVMIGRKREANKGDDGNEFADENGRTSYRCGILTDAFGYQMQVVKLSTWDAFDDESDHTMECPKNQVLVGRYHKGDENGDTQYLCGTIY